LQYLCNKFVFFNKTFGLSSQSHRTTLGYLENIYWLHNRKGHNSNSNWRVATFFLAMKI
jgi:hypothetical protein